MQKMRQTLAFVWFTKKEATFVVLNLTVSSGDNRGINIQKDQLSVHLSLARAHTHTGTCANTHTSHN